jgi:hypothetical protein
MRIVGNLVEKRWVHDIGAESHENGVAVGRRLRRLAGADIAGGARHILDKELLAEMLTQFLGNETGHDVGDPARGVRHDHAHRTRRISLRPRKWRKDGEDRSGSRNLHELSTHDVLHVSSRRRSAVSACITRRRRTGD